MKIECTRTESESGQSRIKGACVYRDTKFTFTVHRASSKKTYSYVLKLNIISPATNKILQKGGRRLRQYKKGLDDQLEQRVKEQSELESATPKYDEVGKKIKRLEQKKEILRKGGRLDDLNCSCVIYLDDDSDTVIKKEVEGGVPGLYGDFQADILSALGQRGTSEKMHARTAYDMYKTDFFLTQNATTKKTLAGKQSMLLHVCDAVNHKVIEDLTAEDIEKAVPHLGKRAVQKLKLAERFLDYCGESHLFKGVNSITAYLQKSGIKKGRVAKKSRTYPEEAAHLSHECEQKLHAYIKQTLMDDLGLAIPLVKGCRMRMDRILKITWGEVEVEGGQIRIAEFKDKFTGATLDYIRPPLGESTGFLLQKLTALQQMLSPRKLKKLRLVPLKGSEKEQKAVLAKYFRQTLQQVGVGSEDFARAVDVNDPKAAGGAGYALLCKHYDWVLQTRCGMDLTSGVGAYLRGMRIHDTTTDSYRSLRDKTGDRFLQTVVRQDTFFFSIGATPPSIQVDEDEVYTTYTIKPNDCPDLIGALTSNPLFIPAGTQLMVESDFGIKGTVSFAEKAHQEGTLVDWKLY